MNWFRPLQAEFLAAKTTPTTRATATKTIVTLVRVSIQPDSWASFTEVALGWRATRKLLRGLAYLLALSYNSSQ